MHEIKLLVQTLALVFVVSGLVWQGRRGPWVQRGYWAGTSVIALAGSAYLMLVLVSRISEQSEWDFMNYWLAGQIAAQGLPLYESGSYYAQSLPFMPSPHFFAEVMNIGTMYTPPAALMFLPLGYFDYYAAFEWWSAVQILILIVTVVLMQREFGSRPSAGGTLSTWLALICVTTLFSPVEETVLTAQLNLLMALLFMLVWRFRATPLAGVVIGVGMCVKPYFGILVFWLLLKRRFGALLAAAGSVAIAFAIAALVIGGDDVKAYLFDNPVSRAPAHLFTDGVNQSLLAVLRRANGDVDWTGSPVFYMPFIVGSLVLTLVTACGIAFDRDARWSLVACLVLGLLMAPQSLYHYTAVLLPVMAFMALSAKPRLLAAGVVVGFSAYAASSLPLFWGTLGLWLLAVSHPLWSRVFEADNNASSPRDADRPGNVTARGAGG